MLQKHGVGHRIGFANQTVPFLTFMLFISELLQLLWHTLLCVCEKKWVLMITQFPAFEFLFHQCAAADKKNTLLNCGDKLKLVCWQLVGLPHETREAVMITVGSEISESPTKANLHDLHMECSFSVSLESLPTLYLEKEGANYLR